MHDLQKPVGTLVRHQDTNPFICWMTGYLSEQFSNGQTVVQIPSRHLCGHSLDMSIVSRHSSDIQTPIQTHLSHIWTQVWYGIPTADQTLGQMFGWMCNIQTLILTLIECKNSIEILADYPMYICIFYLCMYVCILCNNRYIYTHTHKHIYLFEYMYVCTYVYEYMSDVQRHIFTFFRCPDSFWICINLF